MTTKTQIQQNKTTSCPRTILSHSSYWLAVRPPCQKRSAQASHHPLVGLEGWNPPVLNRAGAANWSTPQRRPRSVAIQLRSKMEKEWRRAHYQTRHRPLHSRRRTKPEDSMRPESEDVDLAEPKLYRYPKHQSPHLQKALKKWTKPKLCSSPWTR